MTCDWRTERVAAGLKFNSAVRVDDDDAVDAESMMLKAPARRGRPLKAED
jgi:hypothetical protein